MAIQRLEISLDNLKNLGIGEVHALFAHAVKKIVADIEGRPTLKKARVITLQFDFTPVATDQGELDLIKMAVQLRTKTPDSATKEFELKVSKGGLEFNADFPDSVDQHPLEFGQADVKQPPR